MAFKLICGNCGYQLNFQDDVVVQEDRPMTLYPPERVPYQAADEQNKKVAPDGD